MYIYMSIYILPDLFPDFVLAVSLKCFTVSLIVLINFYCFMFLLVKHL